MAKPASVLLLGAVVLLTSCAITPSPPLPPTHPASPEAPESLVRPIFSNLNIDDATRTTGQLLQADGTCN